MLKLLLLVVGLSGFLAVSGWSGSFIQHAFACNNWLGLVDTDCDQLADTWETSGYNGLNLPAMGSDPNVKDIFLEIDYMTHHKPRSGVLEAVTTAFQNSGVSNGLGNPTGIRLHGFVDENIDPTGTDACKSTFPFSTWFGTALERTNPTLMLA